MKLLSFLIASSACLVATRAFGRQESTSRRAWLHQGAITSTVTILAPWVAQGAACPPRSNNCIATTWTAPDGKDVTNKFLKILETYPQDGQAEVDKGGWTIVSKSNPIQVEYKSGIGNFARFFNGGKPFVDDLVVSIDNNQVAIRSSSRMGDSDMGVNQKRLQYLGAQARALGWTVPEPKY